MEFLNSQGTRFIPFTQFFGKVANQSPVHLSTREETWNRKENKLAYSPNTSLYEANLSFHCSKRAIFTITFPCTQILVVNSAACKLLNYTSEELCSMKLLHLVQDHHKYKLAAIRDQVLRDSDVIENKQEKLVELVSKDGDIIPASLFFKKVDPPPRCLAILEPIDRQTSLVTVDNNGRILSCDHETTVMFDYDTTELIGTDIRVLVPSICLDSDGESKQEISYKQRLTGKTKDGNFFPLCLVISKSTSNQASWQIVIWVFLNISGLLILNRELRISNCNYQIMKLLFGATRDNVLNQKITNFIPSFPDDIYNLRKRVFSQRGHFYSSSGSEVKCPKSLMDPQKAKENTSRRPDSRSFNDVHFSSGSHESCKEKSFADRCRSWNKCKCKRKRSSNENNLNVRLSKSDYDIHLASELSYYGTDDKSVSSHEIDSCQNGDKKEFDSGELSLRCKQKNRDSYFDYKHLAVKEGCYSGYGKHWDGNSINVYYKVKVISFGDRIFYCVWISRDPWEINECPNMPTTVTTSSSIISSSIDDVTNRDSSFNEEVTRQSSVSVFSQNDEILTRGEYSNNYTNIQQIGKGAFGYVKMAFRHIDGMLVVTKFIKKRKINVQSWVFDPKWNIKIPLEISLLANLKHPNIVEVLDVFHNDSFFQLVMKKHGAGMDLFEFIERKPNSDEQLNSYIFRQIISAVLYLDSIGILHRDIKDENVIINEKFEVKLIDFGSATFKSPDKMFSVFYGTVEYCSPEVLQGNKYKGPELEIWALGVTLYVLSFGENPFYDVQETIKGRFSVSIPISPFLFDLLHRMLDKDLETRITIGRVATHPWVLQPVDIAKYKFEDVVHCSVAEADPPRYIAEFTFDKRCMHEQNLDSDRDRTMTSSNSLCSLQTTENTENFDQYEENIQDVGGDFLSDESEIKSSTPVSFASSTNRDDMTKSAGALNRVCDPSVNFKICDRCNCKDIVKKRFSLDVNALKRLSSSSKYSESNFPSQRVNPRKHFSGKLETGLVNDLDEMKLVPNGGERKSHLFDSSSCSGGGDPEESGDDSTKRTSSRETEDTNLNTYPEIYDTSDSRSFDGEDSELFWDADYDKMRNTNEY